MLLYIIYNIYLSVYIYVYIYIIYIYIYIRHAFFNYKHKLKAHTTLFRQSLLIQNTPPHNFIILVSLSFTNFNFILSLPVLHSKG